MSNYLSSKQIWKENAVNFKAGNESAVIYRDVPAVSSFLSTGNEDDRSVLIGSKGMGKSMLIREKAHMYTNSSGDYNLSVDFEPAKNLSVGGLVENIIIDKDEKHTDILHITSANQWSEIWCFAIYAIVLQRIGEPWPLEVKKLLSGITQLSGVISRVIRYSSSIDEYVQHNDILNGIVKSKVQSLAVLYIDGLDNCLSGMLQGATQKKYKKTDLPPSVKVWTNAQIGAMKAVFSINKLTPHLKVGIAVRSEIVPYIEGHNVANLLGVSAELEFYEEELLRMFERKIALTHPNELTVPEADDMFTKFIGFSTIEHTVVKQDGKEAKEVEDVFQYFLRHTFRRPRELTSIGRKLSHLIKRDKYRSADLLEKKRLVREVVNKTAHRLMINYVKEIIPYFPIQRLKGLVNQLSYNVFSVEEAHRLDQGLLQYCFNLGFIGYVDMDLNRPGGELRQKFENPAVNSYLEQRELPETTHFLVHPCLDKMFTKKKNHLKWYADGNIIGHGRKFIIPPESKRLLNDWKPLRVSGGRMHKAHDKHAYPLKKYYEGLFKDNQIKNMHLIDSFGERCDERFELLLKFYSLSHCDSKDKHDVRLQLEGKLRDLGILRAHTAKLFRIDTVSLITFFEKLLNRSLVLSAYLLLNLPLHVIAGFTRDGNFDLAGYKPKGRGIHNYLQAAFFIEGLGELPAENSLSIMQAKLKVWQHLSKVEKYQLKVTADRISDLLSRIEFLTSEEQKSISSNLNMSWMPEII